MGEITYPRTDGRADHPGPCVGSAWGRDGGIVVAPVDGADEWQAYRFGSAPRYGRGWVRVRIACRRLEPRPLPPGVLRREGARLRTRGAPESLWAPLSQGRVPRGYLEMPLPPHEGDAPGVPEAVLVPADAEALVEWFQFLYVSAEMGPGGWEAHLFPLPVGTLVLCPGDVERIEAEGPFEPWVWW